MLDIDDIKVGDYIIYVNGDRYELGRVKSVTYDGAFVCYHEGETAAKTSFREPQWIPCAERLPEDGTYLCWEWQGFCYVDSFKDGNWETAEKCYTKCIAWMPLPEPYREEDQP